MTVITDNKYLQSILDNLVATYETEINYTPIEIELDKDKISAQDLDALLQFLSEERKRLFIFKIKDNEQFSMQLAYQARRSVLENTAKAILKTNSDELTINPLKLDLNKSEVAVRAGIQIQKSFVLPEKSLELKDSIRKSHHQFAFKDIFKIPLALPQLPQLESQLKALDIQFLQDTAVEKIEEFSVLFLDGMIPNNLPKGFYLDRESHTLCYSNNPNKLPSGLAPDLEQPAVLELPFIEQAKILLPKDIEQATLINLLNTDDLATQKSSFFSLLTKHLKEITTFVQTLTAEDSALIIPILTNQLIFGGEDHAYLCSRLIKSLITKKMSLEFLRSSDTQNALLNPRGIKNLNKLIHLPAEQKEWWNALTVAHVKNPDLPFHFNSFFEAYTQIFLPRVTDKNITLPKPCPIQHEGHLLITLNRVLDVLETAENPQEQCLSLANLNWGPTGVHFAVAQAPEAQRLKQVDASMELNTAEDTITDPALVHDQLERPEFKLTPWLYRYMGQHWKKAIRLTDIKAQLQTINNLVGWTEIQKNQLTFILTCTYSDKETTHPEAWQAALKNCTQLLQSLNETDKSILLQGLSRCFNFKPQPSLTQINKLIALSIDLKSTLKMHRFKEDIIAPLMSLLENEGYELFDMVQERIQKTDPENENPLESLTALSQFAIQIQSFRHQLSPELIKLLAKINEPNLNSEAIETIINALNALKATKSEGLYNVLLNALSQINISKSQTLPDAKQIYDLITHLSSSMIAHDAPVEVLTDYIIDQKLLPGCVLGSGDISKLDDLIVDALVDAIKKRSAILKIDKLKANLQESLKSNLVPDQLRTQLDDNLMPVFDALHDLVTLLQTPNPRFEDVIQSLNVFEQKKPKLLESIYTTFLGQSKGEYLLSLLLTGEKKDSDKMTNFAFNKALKGVHSLLYSQIKSFFKDEQNRNKVKDMNADAALEWLATFNRTHSLSFVFRDELVKKKVVPALNKTLNHLDTQDAAFEASILSAAEEFNEEQPSTLSLTRYKEKIESIANYLNLLIDIKKIAPDKFIAIYKQLQSGPLSRLNYQQKQQLINELLKSEQDALEAYLKFISMSLEENPSANEQAIDRAINGLITLFDMKDLEPATQNMFLKMSVAHNLKSNSPFPLTDLNEFKQLQLDESTKTTIIKSVIQILSRMSQNDSVAHIKSVIQLTSNFLTQYPNMDALCIALLKQISPEHTSDDLTTYQQILNQWSTLKPEQKDSLATILTHLATNKKDDTPGLLALLLDITKGLGRRSLDDIEKVLKLFTTPPYPLALNLNATLGPHDSELLDEYCKNFDTNPYTQKGEKRDLQAQFATHRIKDALTSLKDLMNEELFTPSLQAQLAKQLTYIEVLGYTDPLCPEDFTALRKLTAASRQDLKDKTRALLQQFRDKSIAKEQYEVTQLELLAYLREIYFRSTGLFPNTTQMLMLLLSLQSQENNLLMSIKTGEGKSLITPMLAVLQWAQGGKDDVFTANKTLLRRDYENTCEPFFKFLGIESAVIESTSAPEEYKLNGINCSTLEDMNLFRLAAKESHKQHLIQNDEPTHAILDECDDALLDQTTLYKLVAAKSSLENQEDNPALWIYPLAYQFINLPGYRNTDSSKARVWDEEEDLEQFRLFINKAINETFEGDADKQNFILSSSNTDLKQWINASCKAAKLKENKDFIVQHYKEKNEETQETTKRMLCVPLSKSSPKNGCIFTNGVQQALHARLMAENPDIAHYFTIDADPAVLASQSALGLMQFYHESKGRIVGISGTPGDATELKYLCTLFGTQAIGVAPYAGDIRIQHTPVFTYSTDETLRAIRHALEQVRKPIDSPNLPLNQHRNYQTVPEKEALSIEALAAIDKWGQTQTQPVLLIVEDFEDATQMGQQLEDYKQLGFTIQCVTGKESPEKLGRMIKQAGKPNTITIGTAMLARGIDINPGNHPEGLFVIQTYPDSQRMTTQISGRAARNGRPGQWQPIYQVAKPANLLTRILYKLFPWFKEKEHVKTIQNLQKNIKLQASLDRLYTTAVDKAQQVLMQHLEAWESLLLELYPRSRNKIKLELYHWREELLSEIAHAQEATITQESLKANIAQFNYAITTIWENARNEKWAAKAKKAVVMSTAQNIRLNYLNQLDLSKDLNVQSKLQDTSRQFIHAAQTVTQNNIERIILNKASIALEYFELSPEEKKALEIAQAKQMLPNLIGELCSLYPMALRKLQADEKSDHNSMLPQMLINLIDKVNEQKELALSKIKDNSELIKEIIAYYVEDLKDADEQHLHELFQQIKALIIEHSESLNNTSLLRQFKLQNLIVTFASIYNKTGLPADNQLNQLRASYDEDIMKRLASHLMNNFSWVNEHPLPLHAAFERDSAFDAAKEIYGLASQAYANPQQVDTIENLYRNLQKHRIILEDKYLFSIHHRSPRQVIKMALAAMESLNSNFCFGKEKQNACHDQVLSSHYINQFSVFFEKVSKPFNKNKDPKWHYFSQKMNAILKQDLANNSHIIYELLETVERFSQYQAYAAYASQFKKLTAHLTRSMNELSLPTGLRLDTQISLFESKKTQLAKLLQVDDENIAIQKGSDGIDSFIQLQVESSVAHKSFKGYETTCSTNLEKEIAKARELKSTIAPLQMTLGNLSNSDDIDKLPEAYQARFIRLFELKKIVAQDILESSEFEAIPEPIIVMLDKVRYFTESNWTTSVIDIQDLNERLADLGNIELTNTITKQNSIIQNMDQLKQQIEALNDKIAKLKQEIGSNKTKLESIEKTESGLGYFDSERRTLHKQKSTLSDQIKSSEKEVAQSEKAIVSLNKNISTESASLVLTNNWLSAAKGNLIRGLKLKFTSDSLAYLKEQSNSCLESINKELDEAISVTKTLIKSESKKSQYQTQRFFRATDLLSYEAKLAHEEELIPVDLQPKRRSLKAFARESLNLSKLGL